jgi:hypothetical protein
MNDDVESTLEILKSYIQTAIKINKEFDGIG